MTGPVTGWAEEVKARVADEWDACVVNVGYTGVGKSTLAWKQAQRFGPWDGSRMCLSPEEVWTALSEAERGEVVVVDEGVELLYSLDTTTRESRDFVRWLDVCRANGIILIICMASLRWLNARVREDRALWAFAVRQRGRGFMYRRVAADPMALDAEGAGVFRRVGRFRFGKVSGPDWDAYMARKKPRAREYDPAAERVRRRRRRTRSRE